MWVRARAASSKGTVSSVPAWFRADSGTNLIKQGEIVTGRPCGPIAQWSEYSHGLREVLGSSPGRAMCFFLPCDIIDIENSVQNCMISGHCISHHLIRTLVFQEPNMTVYKHLEIRIIQRIYNNSWCS